MDNKIKSLKACTVCANAKVRCDMVLGQKRCTRCERLNKKCQAQPRGSHSRSSHSKKDNFPGLKSKFDSTSNLSSITTTSSVIPPSMESISANASSTISSYSHSPSDIHTPLNALFTFPLTSRPHHLAKAMLEIYRQEMMPLFPFVWIGPDETPEKLSQERPMLYMAILVVACQEDIEIQLELAQRWREELGRRLWTHGEKNLQLLQGVLVYFAWNQNNAVLGDQLNNLMYTAMSLFTELELDKELLSARTPSGILNDATKSRTPRGTRTSDERRCHLGVFWLNSLIRICGRDIAAMISKSYINEHCAFLEAETESPWDFYLVQLVKIQQVASSITATVYQDSRSGEPQTLHSLLAPASNMEQQVQELGATLHQQPPLQAPLAMSFHMLQIFLYKISMDERLRKESELEIDPSPHALRTSYLLVSCLNAVKAVIENFLLLSTSAVLSMPYFYWIQMDHSINMFCRLLIEHPTLWDPNLSLGICEFTSILERISHKIDCALSVGSSMSPPRYLPSVINQMRETLKDICGKVGESSQTMSERSHNIGARSISAAKAFDARNMTLDERTKALLLQFLESGNLL